MISRIAITLLLALGACAAQVDGTELGGVVEFSGGNAEGIAKANAHCQKYGRTARPTYALYGSMTFSCDRS